MAPVSSEESLLMSNQQFIVVTYDIPDDRRRTRLHKRLKDFGDPVQYSVFECNLEPEMTKKMKAMVRKTIRVKSDKVRYYQLCAGCCAKIEILGPREAESESAALVV